MIRHFSHQFSCDGNYRQAITLWGRHSGGGRGTAKAPRSVISMYWKIILRGFYEKMGGFKNTLPKMSMEKMHFFFCQKNHGKFPIFEIKPGFIQTVSRFMRLPEPCQLYSGEWSFAIHTAFPHTQVPILHLPQHRSRMNE
jgi:hypothetical protein